MLGRAVHAIKRLILWDYPRASWQYDVMVTLILAFVFLTPRAWYRDQPRIPRSSRITRIQSAHGTDVFWIEWELLARVPESQLRDKATDLVRAQAGIKESIVRLEPVHDSENELKGYLAFTGR